MTNIRRVSCVTLILGALVSVAVQAQVENSSQPQEGSVAYCQAVVFAGVERGRSRVDLYVQVPYNELSFISDDGAYKASFEMSAQILEAAGTVVWQKNQNVDIRVKEFGQTGSDRLASLRQFSAEIVPGAYTLNIQVTDIESKRTATIKRQMTVRDVGRDTLGVSDILLSSRVTTDGAKTTIVPNVSGSIGRDAEPFSLYFEIYRRFLPDSASLTYRIVHADGTEAMRGTRLERLTDSLNAVIWKTDSVLLTPGQYRVLVDVSLAGRPDSAAARTIVSRSFSVDWRELPRTIVDIDKAVDQLRYIAKEEEIDYVREGKTVEERKERFLSFWAKRDPDARTKRNELMEEYYARVAYANEHYRHYVEGWRTDMGMIFIRFGPPDNVERHPFEINTRPYEVWTYYQQNRQFVFVDESGFGEYRLRYPTTDLWGRIR